MSEEQIRRENSQEEREFASSPMASLLGAPLSWVALFGALTGVGSMIPVIFYVGGGGYASLSTIVLFAVAGYMLGPWAGAAAGLIGGVIGLFIAPAAFPFGPIDIFVAGVMPALASGLMARKSRWAALVVWIIGWAMVILLPYRLPGEAGGFAPPPEPAYILSYWYSILGFVMWLVWAFTPVGEWIYRDKPVAKQVAGFLWVAWLGTTLLNVTWVPPQYYLLQLPAEGGIAMNHASFPLYLIASVIQGVIVFGLFRAVLRTGLRRVPGSLLDEAATGG